MSLPAELSVFRRHGGRLRAAAALFPDAPRPWIDLSTGINPHPYRAQPPSQRELARLPDPEALAELEAAAAIAFAAPAERVAATPGTEAAIRIVPRLLGARSVSIEPPTYGGHAEAWRAVGADIRPGDPDAEAHVVVNPNNPDGRLIAPETLRAAALHRWVIVDEAFADSDPAMSVAGDARGRLVVLRSFGKFYGLPGLRLGFVVAEPSLATEMRRAFGDWPVSTPAIRTGCAAYADAAWQARTRIRLARDRRRLDRILEDAGLTVLGGTDLFRLTRAPDADAVFLRLARAGLLCRPFEQGNLLRFGLPGARVEWDRLATTLLEGRRR
jgi:cobalamin biosynthesis protein CobC